MDIVLANKKTRLIGKSLYALPYYELKGALAKPEGGRIPADVRESVEVICNARHSGGDDVHVYRAKDEDRN